METCKIGFHEAHSQLWCCNLEADIQKISLTIRVDAAALEEWKKQAKRAGIGVSEWIRRNCELSDGGVKKSVGTRVVGSSPTSPPPKTEDSKYCKHGVLFSAHNCVRCDLEKVPKFKREL